MIIQYCKILSAFVTPLKSRIVIAFVAFLGEKEKIKKEEKVQIKKLKGHKKSLYITFVNIHMELKILQYCSSFYPKILVLYLTISLY